MASISIDIIHTGWRWFLGQHSMAFTGKIQMHHFGSNVTHGMTLDHLRIRREPHINTCIKCRYRCCVGYTVLTGREGNIKMYVYSTQPDTEGVDQMSAVIDRLGWDVYVCSRDEN